MKRETFLIGQKNCYSFSLVLVLPFWKAFFRLSVFFSFTGILFFWLTLSCKVLVTFLNKCLSFYIFVCFVHELCSIETLKEKESKKKHPQP
jgi:hypothetical protein